MFTKSAVILAAALVSPTSASLYQRTGDGFCLPQGSFGYSSGYNYLLHHAIGTPQLCSQTCDDTNAQDQSAWPFYRGFAFVKAGGDCYCYYDAGHLPTFGVDVAKTWERSGSGDAQGDIGGSDGSEGVGCYTVIVKETFPILKEAPELFPGNKLRH
ncbi:hypothetical protein ACHAW6_006245 [Cyclotella cf. meneghiniana]